MSDAKVLGLTVQPAEAVLARRNTIEGTNAHLKDAAHEDLENPGRRRVRGFAKQLLLTTLSVVSANLRKIRKWQDEQTIAPAPDPENPLKLARKRRAPRIATTCAPTLLDGVIRHQTRTPRPPHSPAGGCRT